MLLILILIDAIATTYIGTETNPLILWTMDTFGLTLKQAMYAKIIYSLPFLWILNLTDWSRFTFFAYIGLYMVLVGFQF
jgi:hypothetical protein